MEGISFTAHVSNKKSAITSKSTLAGVAKHNLRKYKSISLRAACFILPQNYRTCHPERSRRISRSVRHFVIYLSNIYVIFSSVYIEKIHSRLLH